MKYITSVRKNPLNKISTKQFQFNLIALASFSGQRKPLDYWCTMYEEMGKNIHPSKHVFFCNGRQIIWHDLTEKGQANFVSAVDDIDVKNM